MVNYRCDITIQPTFVFANSPVDSVIDKSHFWIDYDIMCLEFTGDTLLRYGLSGETYTLITILQFYNSRIKSMIPFNIPDISGLNGSIQMFVYLDNDEIHTDTSIFSVVRLTS